MYIIVWYSLSLKTININIGQKLKYDIELETLLTMPKTIGTILYLHVSPMHRVHSVLQYIMFVHSDCNLYTSIFHI